MSNSKFEIHDKVVYPTHGVGHVTGVDSQEIAGTTIDMVSIFFEKDKMTLSIPLNGAAESGLRKLSQPEELEKVRSTLRSRAKTSRGMWSRRAKEYETKINSGSIVSLAEVVRDLHKNVDDPDRSYSERVIYENALNRLAREFAAIEQIEENQAVDQLVKTIKPAVTTPSQAA